jgi:hypothetical protein
MLRPPRLAILFPATNVRHYLPAISQVNEYQFSANTIAIIPSKHTRSGRSYTYFTTTQSQTI